MIPPIALVCLFFGTVALAALTQVTIDVGSVRDSVLLLIVGIVFGVAAHCCGLGFIGSSISCDQSRGFVDYAHEIGNPVVRAPDGSGSLVLTVSWPSVLRS